MYRFLLTPRWIGIHLFAVTAVAVCLWLGTWQLGRFEERVETHRDTGRTAAATTPAAPLAQVLGTPATVRTDTVGRTVTATGTYDPAHQLLVPQRTVDGKQGYYVLTPLRTADGHAVAVVRGWHAGDPPTADKSPVPTGQVTVTGRLQAPESSSTGGAVAGGLPAGQLGMISPATLVNVLPYEVYDGWVAADDAPAGLTAVPTVQPEGGNGLTLRAFQNLGYTLEWFVFAGFVVFMWFRLVRREAEAAHDRALGLLPEPEERTPAPGTA
ncbi:SURF1 family protein [Peterkaempfera bronchialis]|uniref:SURF1-like protein n=1 Tax=Peterkaempfera bronchialis TaxID=2126346 RepID=A0A345SYI9_9ACTN|nr:SURF1 family protein [Peterkaempfera bronchialis]AXI78794.1 SURF1 family protein [Peterkaempfera bronchialis]